MRRRRPRSSRLMERYSSDGGLTLTSMMDILTTLLFFVLKSYVSGGEVTVPPPGVTLPRSHVSADMRSSVVVAIDRDAIMMGGERVASVRDVVAADGLLIAPLAERLGEARAQMDDLARRRGEARDDLAARHDPGRRRHRVRRAAARHVHARPQRIPGHRARGAQEGLIMTTTTAPDYRRPLLDPADALFLRCLAGSAIMAALFVALVRLVPAPPPRPLTQVEQLPQRFAKLILEPKKAAPLPPVAPAAERVRSGAPQAAAGGGEGVESPPAVKPAPAAGAPAGNRRVESLHALPGGGGTAGAARARADVSAQLAGSSSSLKSALAGLNASLGTTSSASGGTVSRAGRSRAVRGAAGVADLDKVSASLAAPLPGGGVGTGSGGDLGGSAVAGSLVSIGDLAAGGGSGGGTGGIGGSGTGSGGGTGSGTGTGAIPGGGTGGSGAGPGVHRSNASLLAVIQRYAPGIQFCYGNELKREPTLRGKLVLALTVAASGEVSEASVVQNTTGSQRLASCALAQVRDWRFPAIASGATTFQAPFVFTPPQ